MKRRKTETNQKPLTSFFSPLQKKRKEPGKENRDPQSHEDEQRTDPGKENRDPQSHEDEQDLNPTAKIKSEEAAGSKEGHSHEFLFKFMNSPDTFTIHCDRPQTVLQALKSKREIQEKLPCDEDKIVLQRGKAHMGTAIATHFPCAGLEHKELVSLDKKKDLVEARDAKKDYRVYNERYGVVFIETKGGINTRSKTLFRNGLMTKFSKLCVYGTEDMTLKEAIDRDGRFKELHDFKLESTTKGKMYVFSDDKIQQHHGKTFKISLGKFTAKKAGEASSNYTDKAASERAGHTADGETASGRAGHTADGDTASERAGHTADGETASGRAGHTADGETASGRASQAATAPSSAWEGATLNDAAPSFRWVPVSEKVSEKVLKRGKTKHAAGKELEEEYERLRAQFPELRKQLLSRYQRTLKKVDFGKAQQAFSDVFRMQKLLELGKSVCKIRISDIWEGTGFVLFKHYIITNAHLFDNVIYNSNLQPDLQTTAMFHYEEPHQPTTDFKLRNAFIDYDRQIDYAIMELVVDEDDEGLVPPGLMKNCGPMPPSGEACLIGHPKGDIKKYDPTCIIEKENREQEVDKHLEKFKGDMSVFSSVRDHIQKQGIERIMYRSDAQFDTATSYNTFMFHGSSGSPVFDAHCRVFGMHTGGFTYDLPTKGSVIEFARPLPLIFHQFVTNLRARNNTTLLTAVEEESKDNPYLMEMLGTDEAMDES